mgnify:CR=1 FL=1
MFFVCSQEEAMFRAVVEEAAAFTAGAADRTIEAAANPPHRSTTRPRKSQAADVAGEVAGGPLT